jgi:hypothetical protein
VVFEFALFVTAVFALSVLLIRDFYYIVSDSSRTILPLNSLPLLNKAKAPARYGTTGAFRRARDLGSRFRPPDQR